MIIGVENEVVLRTKKIKFFGWKTYNFCGQKYHHLGIEKGTNFRLEKLMNFESKISRFRGRKIDTFWSRKMCFQNHEILNLAIDLGGFPRLREIPSGKGLIFSL